jgi:TetR/AcrR family fatty acid metabolism transcriptional regulator
LDPNPKPETGKNTPKKPSHKSKHAKIIRAAIKVFAKNGFHNSKISQIAKEAGVADGTIYLYFKNKDDILIRLFEEKLDDIISNLETALSKVEHPRDKFKVFIQQHLKTVEKNKNLAEVISIELRQSHKFMKEYHPGKFIAYLDILKSILSEGVQSGAFRSDLMPGFVNRAIFGALDEMVIYWVLTPHPKYTIEQGVSQLSDFFLRGLEE